MTGPLDGVRVLDLTRILAGPYCTMVLADLGADVIKVEQPVSGDPARGNGPFLTAEGGDGEQYSTYFMSINRGKRSIAIDMGKPEGQELLLRLAERSDVLIENFRPGTMERLGLGEATLRARNPRLVVCSISGFGQSGPYAHRPALDIIVQGMGGMLSITGEPGGGPVRPGASIGDITAALFAAIAIQAALLERERSGEGQYIDVSMLDCQVAIMENAFMRYFSLGEVPGRIGTRHPSSTPFQAFETADGHVVVAIMGGSTEQWPLFCAAIDHVELIDDDRYATGWDRTERREELIPIIEEAMRLKTTAEWVEVLSEMGVPVGPVQDIAQVAADPQLAHRGMFVEVDHPALGPVTFTGNPLKLSRTPGAPGRIPPRLGEHTAEVLAGVLGMSDAEIGALMAGAAVA
ncbi:MAG: CoA transferase [Chloroflexi bacterium]|nr:CoA transferase [Chloroflexota bacterium]